MVHKTTRSILSVLLAVLLLVTSTPLTPAFAGEEGSVSLQSESGEGGALTGDGTEEDPYKIATADDLLEFADKVNNRDQTSAWAVLTADIDLNPNMEISEDGTVTNGDDLDPWIPIGSDSNPYSGTFDGDGHTISGLYINDSSADYQGLFGFVSGTVQNLSVSGSVSGNSSVGGVVGSNSFDATVKNCYNTGKVSGSDHVGGVVGEKSGNVENCYNTGNISGNRDVGGVVGWNVSSVTNCYNTGEVSGNSSVGGVVGYYDGGLVENCYNTGKVSGNSYVGGVVGYNIGSVTNCYNTGEVSGTDDYVGGVVGDNLAGVTNCYNTGKVTGNRVGGVVGRNSGFVENCYNTGAVNSSGNSSVVGGVVGDNGDIVIGCYFLQTDDVNKDLPGIGSGRGTEDETAVKDLDELCGKFANVTGWETNTILKRPVLTSNHEDDGSKDHPYEIFTATQLENFRDLVNDENGNPAAWAVLMENIDLKGSETNPWTPIGTSSSNSYSGTFDGNGHTISGLYIKSTADDQGLFGRVNGGTVKDLTVSGNVSADWYVGGVVGRNNGGTVTGCIFSGSGSVSGSYYVGGVVGQNFGGNVENCYNTGTVTGTDDYVGGVVGYNDVGGSVTNSYNIGAVSGLDIGTGNRVGGVVGYNDGGTVKNCYNIGEVSGKISVGGVVGYNISSGNVENCYNTDSITGSGGRVGGVVGDNRGTVTNCYNTGTVTGTDDYVGGVVGYNSGSVTNCYNTDSITVTGSGGRVGGVVGDNRGTVTNCYNTGNVSGGSKGGVVGDNAADGNVTGCYFLKTETVNTQLQGIGEGGGSATEKDDTAFHSGEVAWRLQDGQTAAGEEDPIPQVWGQSNLTATTSLPTLVALDKDAKPVYKVAFISDNTEIEAKYANSGMTVGSPTTNPTKEGYTFAGWFTESSGGSQWNFSTAVTENMTLYAQWTEATPDPEPTPTPTPDPTPSGPSTGDSTGWDDIRDELENAEKGEQITIDMGDETKVPAEIFESVAGKDVDVTFDLGDDLSWTVNGKDIPDDAALADLDLGVALDTHGIPVNVINTITGEVGTVQITLAHDGEFGFTMTLTAPLGKENAGYWANLYHYKVNGGEADREDPLGDDEDAEALNFEAAAKIDETGSVTIPFSHASQYAIVIDTHSHATVDVSDIFIDVAPDAWYKDAVQYAYDQGLMTGVSDTEFAPEATTTRAMIVSILARLENVTTAQAAGFADVDDNDWYATAVNWAANVGVVNGYEDNTFRPNTAITREQLAAILMNYAAYKGYDVSARADLSHYSDADSISSWANDVLLWAVAEGLLTGVTDDTIAPQAHATRAQVAAILQRFLSE